VVGEDATCVGCGAGFRRGSGSTIEVRLPGGSPTRMNATDLVDAIRGWDVRSLTGRGADGSLHYEADVAYRRAVGQGVIRDGKGVLGFYEELEPEAEGRLQIDDRGLRVIVGSEVPFDGPWDLIRAVQTSSRTLQVNLKGDVLFSFRFLSDSPRRWEELLHDCLRAHYRASGLEVREFQPRIVTR
jgi:hypothetical protein